MKLMFAAMMAVTIAGSALPSSASEFSVQVPDGSELSIDPVRHCLARGGRPTPVRNADGTTTIRCYIRYRP